MGLFDALLGGAAFSGDGGVSAEKGYRRDIERATNVAIGGYDQAIAGQQEAMGYYQPYSEAGQSALQQYVNLVTGKVDPSQDPYFQQQQRQAQQRMSASGMGGETAQAALQAQLLPQYSQYRQSQLQPLINYGYGAEGAKTGIQGNIGQYQVGRAQTQAQGLMQEAASKYAQRGGGQPSFGSFIPQIAGMTASAFTGNPMFAQMGSQVTSGIQGNQMSQQVGYSYPQQQQTPQYYGFDTYGWT